MTGTAAVESASLDEQVVLLAVATAAEDGKTPANQAQLRAICNDNLALATSPVFGGLSEADVSRALYSLEDAGLVENQGPEETSPTGKGRPIYAPVPGVETIYEDLADLEEIQPLLEAIDRP